MENKGDTIDEIKLNEPKEYFVIIHNDDYTTLDLVIIILMKIFRKSSQEATNIANDAHSNGKCIVGSYPREVAETKVLQATTAARRYDAPLKLTLEET